MPEIARSADLSKDFLTVFPPFYDEKQQRLVLVNEDGRGELPEVLFYEVEGVKLS